MLFWVLFFLGSSKEGKFIRWSHNCDAFLKDEVFNELRKKYTAGVIVKYPTTSQGTLAT